MRGDFKGSVGRSGAVMGNASPGEGGQERGWEMLGIKGIQRLLPCSL